MPGDIADRHANERTILVVGGSGFIGSNLARAALEAGWNVVVPCRATATPWRLTGIASSRLSIRTGWDLNSSDHVFDLVSEIRPQVVVNAAAHGSHSSERNVTPMFLTNVTATATLAEACRIGGAQRLILLGSVLEYETASHALSEDDPLAPETLYGLTKSLSAQIGDYYHRHQGLAVTELRLFNIYGPWDDPRKLIPYVVTRALAGEDIDLTSGTQQRDFVFVEDVVRIVLAAAVDELPSGRPFNVCSQNPIAVAEVARRILKLTNSRSSLCCGEVTDRGDERDVVTGCNARLREFHLAPSFSLDDGLQATIRWYQDDQRLREDEHD